MFHAGLSFARVQPPHAQKGNTASCRLRSMCCLGRVGKTDTLPEFLAVKLLGETLFSGKQTIWASFGQWMGVSPIVSQPAMLLFALIYGGFLGYLSP